MSGEITQPLRAEIEPQFAWANKIVRTYWDVKNLFTKRIIAEYSRTIDREDTEFSFKKIPLSVLTDDGEQMKKMRTKKFLEQLRKDGVTFLEKNGNLVTFSIFRGKITFNKAEDCFEVCPNQDLKDYFFGLTGKMTLMEYNEYMKLPSRKYQTMYEVLKSYSRKPPHMVEWEGEQLPGYIESIEKLHFYLGSSDTDKRNYAHFKDYFLEPMRDYMLKHTELYFEYKPLKIQDNRKNSHIAFIFNTPFKLREQLRKAEELKKYNENMKALAALQEVAEAEQKAGILKLKPMDNMDAAELAAKQREIERRESNADDKRRKA